MVRRSTIPHRRGTLKAEASPRRRCRPLHPCRPIAEPWPVKELRVFDAPTEGHCEINYGPLLREVLQARGWCYSTRPCHGVYDEESDSSTFYVKEFEACLRGKTPTQLFGKKRSCEDGYHLQPRKLPQHALWMMGRMPFRVPGTARDQCRSREDFVQLVVEHGDELPGKAGNYRIAKFPGTERILFKTNFTKAFKDRSWYPKTFVLPDERQSFLKETSSRKRSLWIGKPRNQYGGVGICVWKAADPALKRAVQELKSGRSIMQQYIADPLLVGGYKFHLRVHLLITNISPLTAFVQENGQCLFATKPYRLSNRTLGDQFDPPVHVTNMGLNATPGNKDNFLKEKPIIGKGQQIRIRQLVSHLTSVHPKFDQVSFWHQILDIAAETARYIGKSLQRRHILIPDRHFEIFGMDLMLDRRLKLWMCEVNTDPGIGYPDREVLGSPNPDYKKELTACTDTLHDVFALLGLDAGVKQRQGSLRHWFQLDLRPEAE
mmetsp:Transcript_40856/g.94815  ORF Transcript_40856/g.94815 Transcript_40856/m.94815 type:complete len:490 (+) Transcript_40856:39-1508(+)